MNPQDNLDRSASMLKGVIPPLILPLQNEEVIDFQSLSNQVDYLLAGGIDGIWVNGTSGDFFALSETERAEVVHAVAAHLRGKVPLIAQVGDTATRRVIVHAERALEAGADFIAVILPYYLPYTQTELKQHFRKIVAALGRPVFLYHLPQMSKVALTVPSIVALAEEGVLIGIKESSGDIDFYHRLIREVSRRRLRLSCFNGGGTLVDLALFVGGDGVMCAIGNLVPHACKRIYEAAQLGAWEEVREGHRKVLALIDAMTLPDRTTWAPLVATYKWILRELGVIATDRVFAPLQPLTDLEVALLRQRALPLVAELSGEYLTTN